MLPVGLLLILFSRGVDGTLGPRMLSDFPKFGQLGPDSARVELEDVCAGLCGVMSPGKFDGIVNGGSPYNDGVDSRKRGDMNSYGVSVSVFVRGPGFFKLGRKFANSTSSGWKARPLPFDRDFGAEALEPSLPSKFAANLPLVWTPTVSFAFG